MKKLHAVMEGWKTRQILKMKDVQNKAILVKDHDKDNVKQSVSALELKESRRNAYRKFKTFYDKMERDSSWLMLHRNGPVPGKVINSWRDSPSTRHRYSAFVTVDSVGSIGSDGQKRGSRGSQSRLRPSNIS